MPPATTSLRDRTSEFLSIAERLQKSQGPVVGPSGINHAAASTAAGGAAKQSVAQQTEFARKASQIGLGIHKTSAKLQQLAQLAKRTSMFDDPSAQIDELTGMIKQDIQGLNTGLADLQRASARHTEESKQSADHSHTVVDNLRTRLKDATQEFKEVLTMRTESLKTHKSRRQLFSSTPDAAESAPLLPRPVGNSASTSRSAQNLFGSQGTQGASTSATGGMQMQQMQLVQQDTYRSSRQEALHNVESTIVELGGIFQQLAEMVAAQGEMAQRIDENIEDTLGNVDSAKAQLLKYLNSVSDNRWLALKVMSVLLIFLVLFVFVLA